MSSLVGIIDYTELKVESHVSSFMVKYPKAALKKTLSLIHTMLKFFIIMVNKKNTTGLFLHSV